jgi:outer membrane protein TolC
VRFQDALLQQSIVRYESTVLQAAREIDDAAISVVKTREQDAMLADALASSERALKLATTRYREGYSDFQRVLDAQRSLALQSTNYVANQGAHLNAVIDFYKALGGGWQPATAEDFIPADTRQAMQQRTDWGELLDQPLPQPPR